MIKKDNIVYSIIAPVYNEAEILNEFYNRIKLVLENLGETYEIIFVDDGSQDESFNIMKKISEQNDKVKIIKLSRNFSQEIAYTAGLDVISGECIILIDTDLQDPPEVITQLAEKYKNGYDIVYAVRQLRQGESWFKLFTSKLFYRVLQKIATIDIPLDTGYFRLMNRRVVDNLKQMRERNRFLRGMISWVGFKHTSISYIRQKRFAGRSKYSWWKILALALEGLVDYSVIPLRLSAYLGFIFAGFGFFIAVVSFLLHMLNQTKVSGWTSLILLVTILGGIQLICLGIIGEYLARIYTEVKQRPLYLIEEKIGFNNN
jgi:polyisoprenyl-phosphate glycosyltransferase